MGWCWKIHTHVDQGDANCFLWLLICGSLWVLATESDRWVENDQNYEQTILVFSTLITRHLTKLKLLMIIQLDTRYLPDIAPCDFFLFSKGNLPQGGTRFDFIVVRMQMTKANCDESFERQLCFVRIKRWHTWVASRGCCFRGDKINLQEK